MEARPSRSIALERKMRRLAGGPGIVGYLVVALLAGVALALYFLEATPAISTRGAWFVIGEATGIAAAVLLAVTVILVSRLTVLEWLFGDLTKVYVAHGIIGMAMFALVSLHPMFYVFGTLKIADLGAAAHVIVPFHLVVLDWISYIAIFLALVPTLWVRLPFDAWRWVHMLLGLAMILTGYSILIEQRTFDTADIPALRVYLLVIFGLGAASFIWAAVVRRYADPKREYRITGITHHDAANAVEIRAEPVGKPARFKAGQFAYVDLIANGTQVHREYEAHPYSIASAPGRREIALVIEGVGSHTQRINEIGGDEDARLLIHSAFGRLVIERPERRKQLWIAGGIGITPFLGMAAELARHPERYADFEVTLVACVLRREQAFHMDSLNVFARSHPGLTVHLWVSEEQGRPTVEGIGELVGGDLTARAAMISGPEGMISDMTRDLLAAGLSRGQIRSERPIGPPGTWRRASPALRYARFALTMFFVIFAISVAAATIGRAVS